MNIVATAGDQEVLVLDVDQLARLGHGFGVTARHAAFSLRCERVATGAARVGAEKLHGMGSGGFGVRALSGQRVEPVVPGGGGFNVLHPSLAGTAAMAATLAPSATWLLTHDHRN